MLESIKAYFMEAFDDFWAKVRGMWKSGTVYLAIAVEMYGGAEQMLQVAQSEWLPQIAPFLPQGYVSWIMHGLGLAILYFRFRTFKALSEK